MIFYGMRDGQICCLATPGDPPPAPSRQRNRHEQPLRARGQARSPLCLPRRPHPAAWAPS